MIAVTSPFSLRYFHRCLLPCPLQIRVLVQTAEWETLPPIGNDQIDFQDLINSIPIFFQEKTKQQCPRILNWLMSTPHNASKTIYLHNAQRREQMKGISWKELVQIRQERLQ